jgi:hypothetical protein
MVLWFPGYAEDGEGCEGGRGGALRRLKCFRAASISGGAISNTHGFPLDGPKMDSDVNQYFPVTFSSNAFIQSI